MLVLYKIIFFFKKSIKNFEKQKMHFFHMPKGSFNPKIRFLGEKVCSVARIQTDIQTDNMNTEDTLSWFLDFPFNLSSRISPIMASCRKIGPWYRLKGKCPIPPYLFARFGPLQLLHYAGVLILILRPLLDLPLYLF